MTRLPLTVIGGYLGAGKTSLINRLLSEPHGMRLLVMVNDFGAINIDAKLLKSKSADTLELSNGCVCCTMGADLFMAVGDVLDRENRPDHLIIEASGIADPSRIAQLALAEPELSYGGVVTVVDGQNFDDLCKDVLIYDQILGQITVADLILVSKTQEPEHPFQLNAPQSPIISLCDVPEVAPLILGHALGDTPKSTHNRHPAYVSWSTCEGAFSRADLEEKLQNRPRGIIRLKGFVRGAVSGGFEVHCVGPRFSIKDAPEVTQTQIVAIGRKDLMQKSLVTDWWN